MMDAEVPADENPVLGKKQRKKYQAALGESIEKRKKEPERRARELDSLRERYEAEIKETRFGRYDLGSGLRPSRREPT